MKYLLVFLTFILLAVHGIAATHALPNQSVAAVDSLELCPNFITPTPVGDCGSFLFNLNHIGFFGNMIWNWGDGGSNSGANNVGHTYSEPGEYLVCVQAWTGDCPDGVEVCTTVVVPECEFECPEDIVATELECGLWAFAIHPGTAVTGGGWIFGDGQSAEVSGNTVTHEFSASGEYTVIVNSSLSQPCFNNYFTITINVEVCEAECGLEVEIIGEEGNSLYMQAHDFPEGAQIHWELNGTIVAIDSLAILELQPGENEICVYYETPECPQGVFWCETITIEEPNECPYELIVEETDECGCYHFAISNAGASGAYMWNLGDTVFTSLSHTVSYCFEPGFQTMYVQITNSNHPACNNAPLVHQWEVPECNECTLDVEVIHDGDMLYFNPYNYPDDTSISWQVNGEWMGQDETFMIDISGEGAYEVCAAYETPECPQGVFWCDEFYGVELDCPAVLYVLELEECGCYMFTINPPNIGGSYMWNLGDSTFVSSTSTVTHCYEAGFQTMYVQIMNSNHPDCNDSPLVHQWEVPDCDSECTLDVEVIHDGDLFYFNPFNYPDNATIFWSVNGEGYGPGDNFSYDLSEPGTYQICAAYETPECPQAVFWCETITIEDPNECPYELIVEETDECGCYHFAISNAGAGGAYMWNMGDTTFVTLSHTVSYCFEPGFQTVYVQITNSNYPACNNAPLVHQWEVPDCDDPCGLEVHLISQDGNLLVLLATDYPINAQIHWELNGSIVNIGEITTFELEPGENEICVYYETPECPQGVFWCDTYFIADPNECPFELIVEQTDECGCYHFAISNAGAGSSYMWNLGDTLFTSSSHTVSHCFDPGFQTMYVQIMNSNHPECNNAPLVHLWEVPECEDPECYWFAFQIATNIPGASFGLEWNYTELNGDQVGSGTIQVEGDTTSYTGEICIGQGCYILEFVAPFPISLESLDIDFISIISPIIPVTIEWIQDDNPYTVHAQIGINSACDWSVNIIENALDLTRIFPVPANNILNIQLGHENQTNLRMYNVSGQLVHEQSLQQSGPIDVSALPAGLYLLQLQQGNDFKTFSIPLLN